MSSRDLWPLDWVLAADTGTSIRCHSIGMMGVFTPRIPPRRLVAILATLLVGVCLSTVAATPAMGHGEGESDQASVLVLQAIGFIVNKPGDMNDVSDKINDALKAPDRKGVVLTLVQAAKDALDYGDMDQTRTLLQQSIKSAASTQAAAGEETGTTTVHDPLNTQGDLTGGYWALLAISVLVLALGGWLAVRFRPAESVRVLRRRLRTQPRGTPPAP